MIPSLRRVSYGMLIAFAVVALALGYWSIVRGESLLGREDNPRLVLLQQQIRRGQIRDRQGRLLAESILNEDGNTVARRYASPAAAPVVGYYSLRYGVSGVEGALDAYLRGDSLLDPGERLQQSLLHQPPVGGDVRLTLDLDVQEAAAELLEGQTGSVIVLTVPEGEVLAMASAPTFDPNTLGETWDALITDPAAPLLNRATQSLYQPGEILQSVILGAGLNTGIVSVEDRVFGALTVSVDGTMIPCAGDRTDVDTLGDAYVSACPAPFRRVGDLLGEERLSVALQDFGLLAAPTFTLPTEAADLAAADFSPEVLGELSLGQGGLTVSPLQMALVAAAYADNGRIPPLQLIDARRAPGGQWRELEADGNPRGTISRSSAEAVTELMNRAVEGGAAKAAGHQQAQIYGHAGLALSGPEGSFNAWFIGFARRDDEQAVATAVLLENSSDVDLAARMGGEVLASALAVRP